MIGAGLSAIVIPALFLKRAPLYVLVPGGASLGLGVGTAFHIIDSWSKGEDVEPTGMVSRSHVVRKFQGQRPALMVGRGDTYNRREQQEVI
jgi:hypothetical protein